jgi:hypothetical protein
VPAIAVLVLLAAALFGRGLVSSDIIISGAGADGEQFYFPRYIFAHEILARGATPAWNPYVCSGAPVIGGFQIGLWYAPRALLFALLPLPLAVNWLVFLHVVFAGTGVFALASARGLRVPGALLAGVVFMLGGAFFGHMPPGHFPHLFSMAWIPLVFLGIDNWLRSRRRRWIALAALSAAMQIFAGFPQYFYYTALAAGAWSLCGLFFSKNKLQAALGLLAVYPLACALAAAELVPAVALLPEQMRAGGVPAAWAATASMQFKDLLLAIAPGFFGKLGDWSFWDTEHLHETWAYCGATALALACAGWAGLPRREKIAALVFLALTLTLALGAHTPLFGFLRAHVPLFASFRSLGRWLVFFTLIIALLAGAGLDKIWRGEKIPRPLTAGILAAGTALLLAGLLLYGGALDSLYENFADAATFKPWFRQNLANAARRLDAQAASAGALCLAAALTLPVPAVLLFIKNRRRQCALLLTVAFADLFMFARPLTVWFPAANLQYAALAAAVKDFPPGERDLNLVEPNASILLKREGLWGYVVTVPKRYVELLAFSQNFPLAHAHTDLQIRQNSKVFQLLRVRHALLRDGAGVRAVELQRAPLPRFLVVPEYKVLADRDGILRALSAPDFDFRRAVILEKDPRLPVPPPALVPVPLPADFNMKILSSSASRWQIEIDTKSPGILLMTDSYARGWRATALPGSVWQHYDLQPADYAVRGVPLPVPGRHLLEIKYTPPGFFAGAIVSVLAFVVLAVLTVWKFSTRNRKK